MFNPEQKETLVMPAKPQGIRGLLRTFDSTDSLHEYETMLAERYLPEEYLQRRGFVDVIDQWQGRKKIDDVIRPPKFYGQLGNIVVLHHLDPLEELRQARRGVRELLVNEQWYDEHIIGMTILCDLLSSGRGAIGSNQTDVWVYPIDPYYSNGNKDSSIRFSRIVKKGKKSTSEVTSLLHESSSIGRTMLNEPRKISPAGKIASALK